VQVQVEGKGHSEQTRSLSEEEERKTLARRSQPLQLALPRPANVDISRLLGDLDLDDEDLFPELRKAQRLINVELANLLHHDAITYPLPGTTKAGSLLSSYVAPDDEAIEAAKLAIHEELANSVGFPAANPNQLREGLLKLAKTEDIADQNSWRKRLLKLPS